MFISTNLNQASFADVMKTFKIIIIGLKSLVLIKLLNFFTKIWNFPTKNNNFANKNPTFYNKSYYFLIKMLI
jgi:hypothetical protein